MPNQRSKSQKLLAFPLEITLADLVDATSARMGSNRSQFIRRALVNELTAMGIKVPEGLQFPPDRRAALRVAD